MTPQELKSSILQLAVQGKLVGQDSLEKELDLSKIKLKKTEDYLFDIPNKWKLAHIESICKVIPSKQFQILESEVQKVGKYPVISQSKEYSIGYCDIDEKVFHNNTPVIAFGDHTTVVKYVSFDFVIGADGVKLFEPNEKIVLPIFFFYVLQLYRCCCSNEIGNRPFPNSFNG